MAKKKKPSFDKALDKLLDAYEQSNDPQQQSRLLAAIQKLLDAYQKNKEPPS
ncbi:MAG: hypothetical protein AAF990_12285 [Bacteroidota bacterium]